MTEAMDQIAAHNSTHESSKLENVSLYKRINSTELTRKERLVAQYLLDNYSAAGFMTASGIAKILGISDVTVIRFARKLGYAGFSDLLSAMKSQVIEKLNTSGNMSIPQNRLELLLGNSKESNIVHLAVEKLFENINVLTTKNEPEVFEQAAKVLCESHKKLVIGFRGAASCAESFAFRLSYLLDNVNAVTYADPNNYDKVFSLQSGDCLVAIGFAEYPKALVSLVKNARKFGAQVIVITDKETSPIAFRNDICIFCSIGGIGFNSFAAVLLSLEIIAAYLIKILGDNGGTRSRELVDYIQESDYFWNYKQS